MFNNIDSEDELTGETRQIPFETMAALVYPRPRRVRLPVKLIFVAAFLSTTIGCATASKPVAVEVETVGQLSASYNSVATAPIHASTDLTPAFGAVDSGDDTSSVATTVSTGEVVEAPAVVAKTDGVTVGGAR